jgi:hypothetical protein
MQFLNISNHPSDKWTPEQVEAAKSLGGLPSDVKFPHVDPQWSTEEVQNVAKKLVMSLDLVEVAGAMVAGEPLMTLCIVRNLQAIGVRCFSATTERSVVEGKDGVKTSKFNFVRFREWPTL